ncbi:TonB-dependent receptor [Algiphilus sp.]|uniref:TonB-dependent receptor family protein n=1 Tax=Algiphilus sp. TaxID=1872431 RepID=UPI0025BCA2A9|nr:TonB-dependent receptor [Algiphilus sp.]MCK5768813.1 TonB-dependent receptor [Algiphilus sp.]
MTAFHPHLLLACCIAAPFAAMADAADRNEAGDDDLLLDTITILGTEADLGRITGSAHRVDAATLEQYQYDDINRVLGQVPGVYVREEDGYGLRPNIGLRGGSSDRSQKITLMEDGVLIAPAPYSAPAAYYFPLTTRMTGVEVFKGPSAIQFGPQTVGGAINLLSAPIPEGTRAMAELAGGSDGYRRLHARGGTTRGPLGLLAEVVHLGSDGFKKLDGGGDTGFDKNELLLKGAYDVGPGTLRVRFGYADEVSDETYLGLTDADFDATPYRRYAGSAEDRFDWDWTGLRLGWSQPLLGGELDVVGYRNTFDRAWRKFNNFRSADVRDVLANPDEAFNRVLYDTLTGARDGDPANDADDLRIGTNAREFVSTGVQGSMRWQFATGPAVEHLFETGLRVHSDRIRRDHDEFAYEMTGGRPQRKDATRTITADNTGHADAVALWLRDEILVGDWTIVPGVRIESISVTFTDRLNEVSSKDDYTEVLPGFGANYAVSDALTLLAGVHKGFSPATPGPQENVEPEEAVNWEAGVRWDGDALGRIEVVGFYSDYSNLTAVCTFSSGCGNADLDQQINAGRVDIEGVEAGWERSFPTGGALRFPVALTYTYTATEFRDAFTSPNPQYGNVEPGFELPYVPEHRGNARVGLSADAWDIGLSVTYQSAMRDTAGAGPIPPSEGTDAFTVVDLSASWDVLPSLTVTGRIDNLLDDDYIVSRRPFGARPGLPLSAQIGLQYRFAQ